MSVFSKIHQAKHQLEYFMESEIYKVTLLLSSAIASDMRAEYAFILSPLLFYTKMSY